MEDVPALVPARMVNEFEYCPRLFYLEWVQARFQDNTDTIEGRYVHRRVDAGGGSIQDPSEENPVKVARSVMLGSERLGLIAKADIIESDEDGSVVPVEVKRGRPPSHGPAWSPELVQLCSIGLLLREAGYKCHHGEIFFAETRERRTVPFDDDLVSKTKNILGKLRKVASAPDAPPPLVDSPKCPRCSLVGICLPDETNLHNQRSQLRPRRLTPSDSAARPLYVTEQGAKIGIRGGRFRVYHRNTDIAEARSIDVSQISVFGNVQLSSQLMRAAFSRDIPVCWFSYGGWFQGIAHGLPSKHVELRRRQVGIAAQAGSDETPASIPVKSCPNLKKLPTEPAISDPLNRCSGWKEQPHESTSAPSLECSTMMSWAPSTSRDEIADLHGMPSTASCPTPTVCSPRI